MTVIGNPNPSYRYGLSTRAAWRILSLTVTMDGAADFDIMNLNLLNTATFATGNYSNLRSDSYRKAYPAGGTPTAPTSSLRASSRTAPTCGCRTYR